MPRYYSPRTYQGAKRQLIYGIVLFLIGIAVTVGTYTWASQNGGGTYIISFGPIIFGLIRILTALPLVIRGRGQVAVQTGPMRAGAGTSALGRAASEPACPGLAVGRKCGRPGSVVEQWRSGSRGQCRAGVRHVGSLVGRPRHCCRLGRRVGPMVGRRRGWRQCQCHPGVGSMVGRWRSWRQCRHGVGSMVRRWCLRGRCLWRRCVSRCRVVRGPIRRERRALVGRCPVD